MSKRSSDFIGRTEYLAALTRSLSSVRETGRGAMLAIRGRRQVGKSLLVEEFVSRSGAPNFFFTASAQPARRELDLFSRELGESTHPSSKLIANGSVPRDWEAALGLLGETDSQAAIVVIDEFPYLMAAYPAIEGILQKAWDRALSRRPVLVILIGSDIATMKALSSHGRPLYGRTSELVVRPLDPADVASAIGLNGADALDAYLAVGGFPSLLRTWTKAMRLDAYLREAFTATISPLLVTGERALDAEFPESSQARLVLSVIGAGEPSYKSLQDDAAIPETTLRRTIEMLGAKEMISVTRPLSLRQPKLSKYLISDAYLRFWLRFVGPSIGLCYRGRGDVVADRVLRDWPAYRGKAIEPLVRQAVERVVSNSALASTPFVGSYWTRDHRIEVDLVGVDGIRRPRRVGFVGSIKWRDATRFGKEDLDKLRLAARSVPGADADTPLVAVSRSGFTSAKSSLALALNPDDIISAWR